MLPMILNFLSFTGCQIATKFANSRKPLAIDKIVWKKGCSLMKVVNVKSLIKLKVSIRNEQGEKEGR